MSKRNVAYVKPEEPKFLRLLKEQVGFTDHNPKFDEPANKPDDFLEDGDSEQPQVVVLNPGDLTAEEAAMEKDKIDNEKMKAKADLSQKIVFNIDKKNDKIKKRNSENKTQSHSKKHKPSLLSFELDEAEED